MLALLEPFHHAFGLFGLKGFAGLFDQGHDVAHAKDAACDTFSLEGFQRIHLFAKTDEADRLAGDGAHRQRSTTATVAVHPGEDHAGNADFGVELGGDVDGILPGQAIDDQQGFAGLRDVTNRWNCPSDFVDVQTACGIRNSTS